VERDLPAEIRGVLERQPPVEGLVELLHQGDVHLGLLRGRLLADEVDGGLLVADLLQDPHHGGIRHRAPVAERHRELLHGVDDTLQGSLVVDPRKLVLREEIPCDVGLVAEPLVQVLRPVVEVEVAGARLEGRSVEGHVITHVFADPSEGPESYF